MDNFQLNKITGYYEIPVTLYQQAGVEFIQIFGFKLLRHIVSSLKY